MNGQEVIQEAAATDVTQQGGDKPTKPKPAESKPSPLTPDPKVPAAFAMK